MGVASAGHKLEQLLLLVEEYVVLPILQEVAQPAVDLFGQSVCCRNCRSSKVLWADSEGMKLTMTTF